MCVLLNTDRFLFVLTRCSHGPVDRRGKARHQLRVLFGAPAFECHNNTSFSVFTGPYSRACACLLDELRCQETHSISQLVRRSTASWMRSSKV